MLAANGINAKAVAMQKVDELLGFVSPYMLPGRTIIISGQHPADGLNKVMGYANSNGSIFV